MIFEINFYQNWICRRY